MNNWNKVKLSDVTSRISDGLHSTPMYIDKSDYYFINGNNLVGGSILINENTKCVSRDEYLLHRKELDNSTIFLSINGTIGSVAYYCNESVVLGKSVAYINCSDKVMKQFVYNLLQTFCVDTYFHGELTGSTIKNLSLKSIRDLKLYLPSLPEQKRIVAVLEAWDGYIKGLERKIEIKKNIKKGLMQQLLTGKMRLKGFSGKWSSVPIGKLGVTYSGLTGKSKEDFGMGKPYISYMNIYRNYTLHKSGQDLVKIKPGEKQNKVEYGDILFTTSSETPDEVGISSVLLDKNVGEVYLNSFCFGFRMKNFEKFLPKLAAYLLRGVSFRKEMFRIAQGASRYNLSKKYFIKTKLFLSVDLKEQDAIADILAKADDEIDVLLKKREMISVQKKYLLNKLIAGEIRTPVNLLKKVKNGKN